MNAIEIELPDGKKLQAPAGSSVLQLAKRIGAGLARAALAGRIAGKLVDLRAPLLESCALQIITARDPEGGEVIRHSAEHVMADAVKRLFPEAQVDAGRADHSEKFQYDFRTEKPFTPEDLAAIEKRAHEILKEGAEFVRETVTREQARRIFAGLGEELKLERLRAIPEGEEITLFRHGQFVDLCRGPHVQNTRQIGALKLTGAAGAYWKGDENNEMLQRITGIAFAKKAELEAHLKRAEAAKELDHRVLGPRLGLFHLDASAPGSPYYLPRGMVLYNTLVDFMKSLYPKYGYQEVMTPQLNRAELYKISGHYEMFRDDMYWMEGTDEGEELGVKATNCPCHCRLFALGRRSYRELPLRFAEFSRLHRNERSGTLTGLSRVRAMAQDDAHIFCEEQQVEQEVANFFAMMKEVYAALGLRGLEVVLETRPQSGYIGDAADWQRAEARLQQAVQNAGFQCKINPGEAAFYGPKVACNFKDVLGRGWTLGTVQLDMAMPRRFGLQYTGRDGAPQQPAMLHRAVLGSVERFLSLYIEHTAGDFPLWLAPVQVMVLPIADRHKEAAAALQKRLAKAKLRAALDSRAEKLNYKIREAELQKIPVMAVLGDREAREGTVAARYRGRKSQSAVPAEEFAAELQARADRKEP